MTGDASVDEHDETSDISGSTPATDDAEGQIFDLVGLIDASLFLRERANPYIDRVIMGHFSKLQALKIDTRLASGSGSGQGRGVLNVSGKRTATLSSGGGLSTAYPKILDVCTQVEENHKAPVTAIVAAVRRYGAFAAELDSTNRPLMVPAAAGAMNPTATANGVPAPSNHGFTGYSIAGHPLYKVPAMPTNLGGSTNQDAIIAADWEAIFLFLGGILFDVSTEAAFRKAGVVYRSRQQYAIVADGDPNAIGVVSGAGLVAPTF
jgi:HK97 family phage major capsid protein